MSDSDSKLAKYLDRKRDLALEIVKICSEIEKTKMYDFDTLFSKKYTIQDLVSIKNSVLSIKERNREKEYVEFLCRELDIDINVLAKKVLNHSPNSLNDYIRLRDRLHEEITPVEEKVSKPNYDENYCLGDDPMLTNMNYEVILPKELVVRMIINLDNLRRRKRDVSQYLRLVSNEQYQKITKKFRNLDKNYNELLSIDFENLIDFYNKCVDSIELEPINEKKYRHMF